MKNLRYRRQFLLSRSQIRSLTDWNYIKNQKYHLYAHPDLEIERNGSLTLIGHIFDYQYPEKTNSCILQDIAENSRNLSGIFQFMKRYSGSYVLMFLSDDNMHVFHDAKGKREIYYCAHYNEIICGSQPNLIAEYSKPKIQISQDPELLDFFNHYLYDSGWVGNESLFDGVCHLPPNHYLDINDLKARRYWPNRIIPRTSMEDATAKGCSYLKGSLRAMVNRYPAVMMAVTSGNDSRILLAASRELLGEIYFFINDENLGRRHPDIWVPESIFENIAAPFHVHEVPEGVDGKFRRLYKNNVILANEERLSYIFNVLYREHSNKVVLSGGSEMVLVQKEPRVLGKHRMAFSMGYSKCKYVQRQCEKIRPEVEETARKFNVAVQTLFYWEQKLGNWASAKVSEGLIASEKLDPFNSHHYCETLLGVDKRYRRTEKKPCRLYLEMINYLWPELLEFPINPPTTVAEHTKRFAAKLGIMGFMRELRYQKQNMKDNLL